MVLPRYGRRSTPQKVPENDGQSHRSRICFHWTQAGPEDVEMVDYH
jgi:hypothetical protein